MALEIQVSSHNRLDLIQILEQIKHTMYVMGIYQHKVGCITYNMSTYKM
jgi:hypothetical protein